MKNDLAERKCSPCKGDVPPIKGDELRKMRDLLRPGWEVIDEHHLEKQYIFKDFKQALEFTNKVGALAEEQQHHPDIYLAYGKAKVTLWTHKIGGLSENDFIFAAKVDNLV